MKSLVSMLSLAVALSVATPAFAQTAADADAFVAKAEKELAELNIFGQQVAWVNNTYLTDDTDARFKINIPTCPACHRAGKRG